MPDKSQSSYRLLAPVDSFEVPSWARRPPRWNALINAVLQLKKGEALPIQFDDPKEAARARNTVRDTLGLESGRVAVQTRMVLENGKCIVYFTMLLDDDEKPEPK